ncbi:lytic murein transglycosylase, partial [Enterococcus hirae]
AHTLQKSDFRSNIISNTDTHDLIQIHPKPANNIDLSTTSQLFVPSTNIKNNQHYLKSLHDINTTSNLLPKMMTTYNA